MDRSGLWAVVPVKNFADAKQRLAGVLSRPERQALFRAMVEDVLETLASSSGLAGVLLVTRDPEAKQLADYYQARVLVEERNAGHTAATCFGARTLKEEGALGMLQVPGDIPLISTEDINTFLQSHSEAPAITIAPSWDQRGSNAIACSPPDLLPLRFGDDSFFPHVQRAREVGVEPSIVTRPGFALDLDTPGDVARFLEQPSSTRAYDYLIESGVAARLLDDVAQTQETPP